MSVLKIHVSFESVYYVNAKSLSQARDILSREKLGDSLNQRNVSLLHVCTDNDIKAIKKQGIKIIGETDGADNTDDA